MNILLVGENEEILYKWRYLLELAHPNSSILEGNAEVTKQYLHQYYHKTDLIVCLPTEPIHLLIEILTLSKKFDIPVLCVVTESLDSEILLLKEKGVQGIIRQDTSINVLRNGIQFVKEKGTFWDPKVQIHS